MIVRFGTCFECRLGQIKIDKHMVYYSGQDQKREYGEGFIVSEMVQIAVMGFPSTGQNMSDNTKK